jgi:hypothetical protein
LEPQAVGRERAAFRNHHEHQHPRRFIVLADPCVERATRVDAIEALRSDRAAVHRALVGADAESRPALRDLRRALSKACKRLNIPKPPRGYWAKKAAGQPLPPRPKLPRLNLRRATNARRVQITVPSHTSAQTPNTALTSDPNQQAQGVPPPFQRDPPWLP